METKMDWTKELTQFYGTEQYYKGFMGVLLTDGVYYVSAKAGWLISDMSVILKIEKKVLIEDFVSITVTCEKNKASVVYTDGNGKRLFKQDYDYAELPDSVLKFFYRDGVLMLSSEY